jgi:MFS family permease
LLEEHESGSSSYQNQSWEEFLISRWQSLLPLGSLCPSDLPFQQSLTSLTRSFLFGYDAGVMTDVIGSNNFLKYFNTVNTSPIIGAINSTFNGGAVFGSLMGGFTMDRFGRRMTIQMGALICLLGAILQAAARNLGMILVGRIFAGWAVGLLSMSVPVCKPPF